MALVKRTTKGSKLTIAEMDGNLDLVNSPFLFRVYSDPDTLNYTIRMNSYPLLSGGSSGVNINNFPYPSQLKALVFNSGVTITSVAGFSSLTGITDIGTSYALDFSRAPGMTDTLIDSVFTQLPSTSATATVNVQGCPGAATCNPSIATAKGYTVVT